MVVLNGFFLHQTEVTAMRGSLGEQIGEGAFADVVRPRDLHGFFLERSGRASRQLAGRRVQPCAS